MLATRQNHEASLTVDSNAMDLNATWQEILERLSKGDNKDSSG